MDFRGDLGQGRWCGSRFYGTGIEQRGDRETAGSEFFDSTYQAAVRIKETRLQHMLALVYLGCNWHGKSSSSDLTSNANVSRHIRYSMHSSSNIKRMPTPTRHQHLTA